MKKRRLGAIVLVLALLVGVFAGANGQLPKTVLADETALSGSCGENLYWQLIPREEGGYALLIGGSGKMPHFPKPESTPWYEYREQIHTVTLEEGVTCIGNRAFYECTLTGELTLPDSLTYIGNYAFYNCTGLTGDLVIPPQVRWIGAYAFYCNGFDGTLQLPEGLERIEVKTFEKCNFTGTLTIPETVYKIGTRAFYQCDGFEGTLVIPKGVTTIGRSTFNGCTGITEVYLYSDAKVGRSALEIAVGGTIYNLSETIEDEDLGLHWYHELGAVYSVYGMVNGTERLLGKVTAPKEGEEPVPFVPE